MGSPILLSNGTPDTPAEAGVVVVSWNVRELLLACLASVQRSQVRCRIVVVDNASSDGSEAAVRSAFPDVQWIQNTVNAGFTRANNQGLRQLGVLAPLAPPDTVRDAPDTSPSRTDVGGRDAPDAVRLRNPDTEIAPDAVLLLNPDTEVAPDAIPLLLRCLEENPRTAVVGPALFWPDGRPQSSRRRFPTLATGVCESTPLEWHWRGNPWAVRYRMAGSPDEAGPVDWVSGAALMLRTKALRETGGFDEDFFMYSEETDLCRRLAAAGWKVRYEPSARIVHHEGQSSAQNVAARHILFHRARIRYFRKHHGRAAATAVRCGVLAQFTIELGLEALKFVARSRPALRRERIGMYRRILADGLGPSARSDVGRRPGPGASPVPGSTAARS